MGTQVNFILKVLIFSGFISILIRYAGPSLAIAPTSLNTLIAVLTPPLVLATILVFRALNYQPRV
ncbi:MAG: hypothetical protein WA828_10155 [Coleofasciculaceae cyanobacterium]